ncbi:methyltransferase domain-containing protein [Solirubrobacter sp. CPCC 204708]|uniref:Methyltransferase domain-containing protein n=1 Tax=Solirubrobacter deserti TaxID=2282478 RepID=A0ABT4RGS3_9ACTN|nr:methyltransferase domain-containing protein [Solirubrobacter deserti]MBE2315420.1 methyltransferase domain-containing protein [Solirubrobacter deserti]MDA0137738.1 methyltransferase domain-containing protein [Solirubrobacter deserti]
MDDGAIAALRDLYSDLEIDGRVLDLCGGGYQYFEVPPDALVEFDGEDRTELPYADAEFDDVVCLLRGLAHPNETLVEVARVLKPGGHFVCSFVGGADDAGRVRKLRKYFDGAPAFGGAESDLRTSLTGSGDRLWAVWAVRRR